MSSSSRTRLRTHSLSSCMPKGIMLIKALAVNTISKVTSPNNKCTMK